MNVSAVSYFANARVVFAAWLPLLIVTSAARAEEATPTPSRSPTPALSPAPGLSPGSAPAPEPAAAPVPSPDSRAEFKTVVRGLVPLGIGVDTGQFGVAIRGVAGAQWSETRTIRDRRVVLRWNGSARFTAGCLGNTLPLLGFVGGQLGLEGEVGARLMPKSEWSPYVGAGGVFQLSAVALPAVPIAQYDTINDPRGVAGVNGTASARLSVGASDVGARHALHLTAFGQESARAPETFARTVAFTEVGARAQLDVPRNVQLAVEATHGWARAETEPIFLATSRGTFLEGSLFARKFLRDRYWLGLDARMWQRRDRTTYEGGQVYETASIITTVVMLSWGLAL